MEKDLISIIVPCYNVASFIDGCFKSIENLTYKNIEVIFVNDGSTDSTLNKINDFIKRFPKARVISQSNVGVSAARNRGLQEAKGEYVYMTDPDDVFHNSILEMLYKALVENNVDVSICKYSRVSSNYRFRSKKAMVYKSAIIKNSSDEVMANFLATPTKVVWDKLFKIDILKKIEGFPNVFDTKCFYGEDTLFCCKYFSLCSSSAYIKKKLYYWRQRRMSATHGKFDEKKLTSYKSYDFLKTLDSNKYVISKPYIYTSTTLYSMDLIVKLSHTPDYNNAENAKLIYKRYIDGLAYFKKANLYSLPYRFGTMFTKPVMYLMIRKKLKG